MVLPVSRDGRADQYVLMSERPFVVEMLIEDETLMKRALSPAKSIDLYPVPGLILKCSGNCARGSAAQLLRRLEEARWLAFLPIWRGLHADRNALIRLRLSAIA